MVSINYELPDDVHQRAKVAAAREGLTLKEWVIRALDAAGSQTEAK